jgi:hypothetical protein
MTDLTPEITCRKAIAPGVPRRELWWEVLVAGKYHSSHPTIVDAHDRMRDIKAAYEQHHQHDRVTAPAPMPMVGLLLLDARQQMIEGGPR